jgi:hypothetical protein
MLGAQLGVAGGSPFCMKRGAARQEFISFNEL